MAKKRAQSGKRKKRSTIWVKLGRKGGKARAARLTAVERYRIAMLGVAARRAKKGGTLSEQGGVRLMRKVRHRGSAPR